MQVFIKGTGTKVTLTQREYVAAGGDSRFFAFICERGEGIIIPTFTDEGDTHYGQTSHLTGKSVFELWQDIQEQNCDRWAGQSSLQSEILFGLSPFQINIPNAPSRFCFHGPEQDLLSLWEAICVQWEAQQFRSSEEPLWLLPYCIKSEKEKGQSNSLQRRCLSDMWVFPKHCCIMFSPQKPRRKIRFYQSHLQHEMGSITCRVRQMRFTVPELSCGKTRGGLA